MAGRTDAKVFRQVNWGIGKMNPIYWILFQEWQIYPYDYLDQSVHAVGPLSLPNETIQTDHLSMSGVMEPLSKAMNCKVNTNILKNLILNIFQFDRNENKNCVK